MTGERDAKYAELEQRAKQDHQEVLGRKLRVRWVYGYVEGTDDNRDYAGDFLVRVLPTDAQSLAHWNYPWLDPYWDVEVLDWGGMPPLRSTWISGHSYNVRTGEVTSTDITVVEE